MTALIAVLLTLATFSPGSPAEDSLAMARDLYASAAYEDALAVLNRLPSNQPIEEARAAGQYRAMCLLALGRTSEADRAIEAVVAGDPGYRPATDVSPRVRAAFSDVRKRVLPAIIQQKYAAAKAAFDRKQFAAAVAGFTQMLKAMTDPDVEAAAGQPPLSDLRTLASGFRDLAEKAIPPPPPPAPEPVPAAPPPPPPPAAPKVYGYTDSNVVPPVPIRQDLPPFPGQLVVGRQGMIDVIINEAGMVEAALMTQSVSRVYDGLAVAAAREWRYRPAMLNGVAVKYRKAVQISVKPH